MMNIATDYAIRTLIYLRKKGCLVDAVDISEHTDIPQKYLMKVLRKLKRARLVGAVAGAKGGYYLKKSLSDIELRDVFNAMDSRISIYKESENANAEDQPDLFKVKKYYQMVQGEIEEMFFSISLEKILQEF